MPLRTKSLFITLAFTMLGATIYFSTIFSYLPTKRSLPGPVMGEVVLDGTLLCLPKTNTHGSKTTDCTVGLLDQSGRYYGLRDPSHATVSNMAVNTAVVVEGMFQPLKNLSYPIEGVIEIRSIAPSSETAPK